MRIGIAADQRGFVFKKRMVSELKAMGHEIVDYGALERVPEDDDMRLMCLGGRVVGFELARDLVHTFPNASFKRDERFLRRLRKVEMLEAGKEKH